MDILSEVRRAGYHMVGVVFLLALYCGLCGSDAVGAELASTEIAVLTLLAMIGGSPQHLCHTKQHSDDAACSELEESWQGD